MKKNFKQLKQEAETFYKSIESVMCPYFSENVAFNAMGLEHMKFKGRRRARSKSDQVVRFKLFHLAPEILRLSKTVQGVHETKEFERLKVNSRWEQKLVPVTYYEFIAVLEGVRVRIIVKSVNNGPKFFWSIIPNWKVNKNTLERKLHSGDPSRD